MGIVAPSSSGVFSPLALGAALGLLAAVVSSRPALAADLENGEGIFTGNCAACHSGGNNSIATEKKIKKEALVTYGKIPAFGEKLGPDDIEDVANYVYNQADKWP